MNRFFRHIAACNNAVLPGARLPFSTAGQLVGWLDPALEAPLRDLGATGRAGTIALPPEQIQPAAKALAEAGHFRWRGEAFDVRAAADGPSLAVIDRGALPRFGIQAEGVHLNAMVQKSDGIHLWVARRARDKQLDPGKLDHLVAGGIPAGMTPYDTLVKEAEEEAGLSAALLEPAKPVGIVEYAMERPEGLRRDRLHCYDLILPADFQPEARDGEVEGFELLPIQRVFDIVLQTNDFKFNVNLVLIELFRRLGLAR